MNPASRNSNSHVTNIGITSPLGKAKKNLRSRKGKQPPPYMVLYGYLKYRIHPTTNDNKSQYITAIYTRSSEVFRFGDFLF